MDTTGTLKGGVLELRTSGQLALKMEELLVALAERGLVRGVVPEAAGLRQALSLGLTLAVRS